MKEIGGYFELELPQNEEYHSSLLRLNSGRCAFEYILRARKYKKIYIPYYTCEVILEPINKLGIEYEFYNIGKNLNIQFNKQLNEEEALLITNYFGIKNKEIRDFSIKYRNIIVDNTQAFYDEPIDGVDTFYSPRKFFGVPDGAYLSTDIQLNENFEIDKSYGRMSHLLKRIDESASFSYGDFKNNNDKLVGNSIKQMSKLTQSILKSIDYKMTKLKREHNFLYLHSHLEKYNELEINMSHLNGPMAYPFLCSRDGVKESLINNKIYVATYWPNVFNWTNENFIEYELAKLILPLPIDQRYNLEDMNNIINCINAVYS